MPNNLWSTEEDSIMRRYWPTEGSKILPRLPGRTYEACRTRAIKLGIVIDQKVRERILKEAGYKKFRDPSPEELAATAAEIRRQNDERLRNKPPRRRSTVADLIAASLADIPDDLDPEG